jgi:hypothetical protein
MPKFKIGDIWTTYGNPDSTLFVTTNSTLDRNGHLVMGAGSALHAVWKEPDIKERFGSLVKDSFYGILFHPTWDICAFQTKSFFKHPSNLLIIKDACEQLRILAQEYPDSTFNLCYPGIGFGRLSKEDVHPLLLKLPDNVVVWSFD